MPGICDIDRRTLCLGADVNYFQRAFLQRNLREEGRQQGNGRSENVEIAAAVS